MTNTLKNKLDVYGRHELRNKHPEDKLEAIVKMYKPLSPEMEEEIIDSGFQIHSRMERFLTGCITVKNLEKFASLPFIQRIEISFPMYIER